MIISGIKQWLDLICQIIHWIVIVTLFNFMYITPVWASIFSIGSIWPPWVMLWLRSTITGLAHSSKVVLTTTFITVFSKCWAILLAPLVAVSTVITLLVMLLTFKVSMTIFEAFLIASTEIRVLGFAIPSICLWANLDSIFLASYRLLTELSVSFISPRRWSWISLL